MAKKKGEEISANQSATAFTPNTWQNTEVQDAHTEPVKVQAPISSVRTRKKDGGTLTISRDELSALVTEAVSLAFDRYMPTSKKSNKYSVE